MITKNSRFKIQYFLILFFCYTIAGADELLLISAELQPGNSFCWATCADMLLQFYGNPPNLHGIVVRGTNGIEAGNGLCDIANSDDLYDVHDILNYGNSESDVSSSCHTGVVLFDDAEHGDGLIQDIQNVIPIIAELEDDDVLDHVVLVIGFTNDGSIFYNDPANGKQGKASYATFCLNTSFYWSNSLVPDDGSAAGKVPVLTSSISISSGPTAFSYPGSNATYASIFACATGSTCMPPTTWNWSLSFYHNTGTYTVASVQNLSGTGASTWNVPAFTLPTSGYKWMYNESGLVTGIVTLTTGGYSIWKTVTYAPQTLIPGEVDFSNQTVSGTHSEVDAHYTINMNTDTFNAGTSINFKAGSGVNISPSFLVNYGTTLNITIDPTLQ
jgi:hypothetical protein